MKRIYSERSTRGQLFAGEARPLQIRQPAKKLYSLMRHLALNSYNKE